MDGEDLRGGKAGLHDGFAMSTLLYGAVGGMSRKCRILGKQSHQVGNGTEKSEHK